MVTGHGDIALAVKAMQIGRRELSHEASRAGASGRRRRSRAREGAVARARPRRGRASRTHVDGDAPRLVATDARAGAADRAARAQRAHGGAARRRVRSGEGARRASDPRAECARRARLPRDRLLDASGDRRSNSSCSAWSAPCGGPVPGLFEAADGGTLFLDEIADLPATLQPTLLARAGVATGAALGGHARGAGRRARHRGDGARSRDRGDGGALPRGSLLPARRDAALPAAAARALARGPARDGARARRRASSRDA